MMDRVRTDATADIGRSLCTGAAAPAIDSLAGAASGGLIDGYRRIENVASEMLAAGRSGDWSAVRRLEATIRDVGDHIARAGGPAALTPEQRSERMRILKRIIILDGELRHLSDPMAGWLDTMMARRATPEQTAAF